jgi:hypothetical protein
MKSKISFTFIALAFILPALIAIPVSAVSITESPSHLQRGDPVTITIHGLNDGSQFSMQIEGRFSTLPGTEASFQTSNFYMPISLNEGTLSATTRGTQWTELSVKKGTTTVNLMDEADASGVFTVSQSYSASTGTYNYLKLRGQARPDVSQISTQLSLAGTKQGPSDSQITFNVDGIDDGSVTVIALVDGQQVLYQTIIVGNGATATPTTSTPVPTTSTTNTATTTTVTSTGTATSSVTTTAPTGTVTTTTVPVKTFYSADNKVALSAQSVDYAALIMVNAENIPSDWVEISSPYTLAPESLAFSPAATISFNIPQQSATADYAYFIGRYVNNQWISVPSKAGGTTIQAQISQAGTYSLMAYKPESTLPVTGTAGTPAATPSVKGTPRIASIATVIATPQPGATTKQSPSGLLLLPIALAICCALVLRRE